MAADHSEMAASEFAKTFEDAPAPRRIAFAFLPIAGHFNPSLPLARKLASLGHDVHYLCHECVSEAITSTGAAFHSIADQHEALSSGRFKSSSPIGIFEGMMEEYGVEERGNNVGDAVLAISRIKNLALEVQLPGTLRFLSELRPHALVYDPMILCRDAFFAAVLLGIPTVSLLTVAGPGGFRDHMSAGVSLEMWEAELGNFEPHVAATERLNAEYRLGLEVVERPILVLEKASVHLVTTSEALQDPPTPRLAEAYRAQDAKFVFVGPLLDQEGSARLGAARDDSDASARVLAAAREARAVGRRVVMVSMGTLLTSDAPSTGWQGRALGADGRQRGLTGRELCQAAWGGAFDALGAASEHEGPLLVLSLGNRVDALDGLAAPPPNAVCSMGLPQVDLLRLGVDLFLTHGGQNSFMESISNATPVVVCPGFGDQMVNARKAAALGVGVPVARPDAEPGQQEAVALRYRSEVSQALLTVLADPSYGQAARRLAAELREAGGVAQAVEIILGCAAERIDPAQGGA